MKHNLQVTLILIAMFLITQLIGLAVINIYAPKYQQIMVNGTLMNVTVSPQLPYGMQPPEMEPEISLTSIIIAFIIAVSLIFLLTKIKATLFLRFWFFFVVIIVVAITINALLARFIPYDLEINTYRFSIPALISLIIALPLAYFKIFKRNILIHNLTELMIYPGIAAVFVPILNIWAVIALLLIISIYDIWAVWHSGFMQKMAKFQINQLKIFAGFFVPYLGKRQRQKIKKIRIQTKRKNKQSKEKKIRVNLAILGGGDIVFPIITAGVVLTMWGWLAALIVTVCATISLFILFVGAKKGKFYPAMPFLTAGLLIGMGLASLF